jgi:hypothetical protein
MALGIMHIIAGLILFIPRGAILPGEFFVGVV